MTSVFKYLHHCYCTSLLKSGETNEDKHSFFDRLMVDTADLGDRGCKCRPFWGEKMVFCQTRVFKHPHTPQTWRILLTLVPQCLQWPLPPPPPPQPGGSSSLLEPDAVLALEFYRLTSHDCQRADESPPLQAYGHPGQQGPSGSLCW